MASFLYWDTKQLAIYALLLHNYQSTTSIQRLTCYLLFWCYRWQQQYLRYKMPCMIQKTYQHGVKSCYSNCIIDSNTFRCNSMKGIKGLFSISKWIREKRGATSRFITPQWNQRMLGSNLSVLPQIAGHGNWTPSKGDVLVSLSFTLCFSLPRNTHNSPYFTAYTSFFHFYISTWTMDMHLLVSNMHSTRRLPWNNLEELSSLWAGMYLWHSSM